MLGFVGSYWPLLLLFFSLLLLFLPAKLQVRLYREPNRVSLKTRFTLWFVPFELNLVNPLTRFFWNLSQNRPWEKPPPADLPGRKIKWQRFFSRMVLASGLTRRIWGSSQHIYQKISSHIKVSELRMHTEIGLWDAAQTAVGVGIFWSLLGFFYTRLASLFTVDYTKNSLNVVPNYSREGLLVIDYSCIFEFRLGHIIIIIYQILREAGEIYTIVRRISK